MIRVLPWLCLATLGAWLTLAAYQSLLCPPRLGRLSERAVMALLIGALFGGLALVLIAGIGAVAG